MEDKQVGQTKSTANNTGLESLEQAPANERAASTSSSKISQNRPTRPWKKQAILLLVVMFFVSGLGFAALRLAGKVKNASKNQSTIDAYNTVQNPVLGDDTLLPVQSLNDQTVTINGDLTVQGKLNLSAQALNDLASILGNTVSLSPVLGGPAQVGNINISGGVAASSFQGSGAALTGLNASNITEGTLSNERLDGSVTRLGQTIPLSALQSTVLSSLNGISNNGSASIVGSGSVSVSTDVNTGTITVTGAAGGINGVIAGTGLTGGGLSGTVTLDVDSGVVTMQGNTFNGTNQLVKLNGAGELPVISATNLTNLNASNISSGTISDSRLSANVTLQGNTFNLANKLVKLDNSGNLPALSGAALTNLNASNIGAGTLADGRLSANVALLNANQTFTGNVVFSQPLTVNVIQPSASMVIGATNQSLTLQGDLTTKLTATSGSGTVSLGFTGTPTGNVIYNLDAATSPGTYTLCTTVGNCASAGGGVTTLGGNTNKLAKFTGSQSIGDSSISDTGSLVTIGAAGLYKAGTDSTTAFRVQNAAGSTNVFTVDSTNTRVAIGQATAGYTLDVNGDINSATGLRVGGNLVCDASGCAASAGANFYIQNGTSLQTGANFNIESTATTSPTVVLKAKSGQTANLLQATDASNNVIAKIDASGNISTAGQFQVNGTQISSANLSNDSNLAKLNGAQTFSATNLFRNATDSTTAFRIQNAAASNLFVADTTNTRIAIGQATAGYTLDVNGDINIAAGNSFRINGVAICGPTATCAPSSGSNNYVQNGLTTQTANINIQSASSSSVVAVVQGATGQTADLLQARDQNNNVVAKITSTGAIYQGSNQVCDTSNNCGYAIGSGSNNYIQNGTSTQTANMNIKSADANSVTATIQGSTAQVADILQVTSGGGSTLLGVSQNTTNIITNPSFDIDTTGWATLGSASIARSTADQYIGPSSLLVTTTATANDGIKYNYQFAASTSYAVSFYARVNTTQWGSMQITFTNDGTTQANCVNNQVVVVGGWTRYTCSFTTTASVSGTRFIGIRQTDATARSFYIDAVQVEAGTTTSTAFQQGTIALNGVVSSPVAIRTQSNSNTAFSLQNTSGTNIFSLSNVGSGGATVSSGFALTSPGSLTVTARGILNINGSGAFQQYVSGNVYNGGSFQVGDTSQNNTLLTVSNTATPNLITLNPSFDTGTGGVSALGTGTFTRSTLDQYSGVGSLRIVTAAASDGAKYSWATLANNTTYTFSVFAKATGANFSTFEIGYSNDGTNNISCATAQTVVTTQWTRYSCIFTTSASGSGRYVYYRQTDATARTFYVDAMQIEAGSTVTPYQMGTMNFGGSFIGPAVFKNQSDSQTAFQIQNNAGTSNLFIADTVNNRIAIGQATASYALDVVGDVNASTSIKVGGNTVCTSTGCTVSATDAIKNQTTTQTGNMNIQSANASNVTAVIQGAGAQTADILQVVDGTGQVNVILGANQTTSNLVPNSSFETNVTGWNARGTTALSRLTSDRYHGTASMQIAAGTFASGNNGVNLPYSLASSTTYTISFYFKSATTAFQYIDVGRSDDGSTETVCAGVNQPEIYWQRVACTFTTGTTSGSPYIFIRNTNGSAKTFYIDAVQLETGSIGTPYQVGQVNIGGVVTSPVAFRNAFDSTKALSIANAAGTEQLSFDTVTNKLSSNNGTIAAVGGSASLYVGTVSNGSLTLQSPINGNSTLTSTLGTTLKAGGAAGYATALVVQDGNSNSVINVNTSNTSGTVNLITNPSFDASTTGWTAFTGGTLSRITTDQYSGAGSLSDVNTATANAGGRFNYTTVANTTYTLSMFVKSTANFSTFELGYTDNGSTNTSCATGLTVTTGWTRVSCTFTTGASLSGTRYVYFRQTDATARTILVDAAQLELGTVATTYSLGVLSLNGTINSPTVFKNQADSSTAFQVQNAASDQLLNIDTTTSNLISNSSFESGTTGWTAKGTATISRVASQQYIGNAALQIDPPAANDGVKFNYALTASTTYTLSMYYKTTATMSLQIGRSTDGTNESNCSTISTITVNTTGWTRQTCTFTTTTVSGTTYIYAKNGTAALRTFYIDAVQLEIGSNATSFQSGAISLNGVVNSALAVRSLNNSTTALQVQDASGTNRFTVDTLNMITTLNMGNKKSSLQLGDASTSNYLNFGWASATNPFSVGASGAGFISSTSGTLVSESNFAIQASTTSLPVFIAKGASGQVSDLLQAQDSNGNVLAKIDKDGNLTVKSLTVSVHIISGGSAPTIAAGAAAGTSPTVSISGTDTAGTITLTTGTSPSASANIVTSTFASAFGAAPRVVFSPANASAATLSGATGIYVDSTVNDFTLIAGSSALAGSTQYKWTYVIIQ